MKSNLFAFIFGILSIIVLIFALYSAYFTKNVGMELACLWAYVGFNGVFRLLKEED